MGTSKRPELQEKMMKELAASKKLAEREMMKIKSHVTGKLREVERYVEKNPEKAALVSAGIGAALGAALAFFMGRKKR